jgi:hypothetical protein
VANATVEADRFVGSQVATTQTTTAADGSFSFTGILGGRWRIRAWQAPQLDLTTPDIFFLGGTQSQTLTLTLSSFTTAVISAAVSPSPPVDSQPANLVVRVESATVTAAGIVTYVPVAGAGVALSAGSGWQVTSPNPATTDSSGDAGFQLVCSVATPPSVTASVTGVGSQALNLPDCVTPPPPPPPTTPTTPTTVAPSTSSSSTVAPTTSSTSVTTPTTPPPHG